MRSTAVFAKTARASSVSASAPAAVAISCAEQIGGADRVLASHDLQRRGIGGTEGESGHDRRRHEPQHRRADRGRDDIGRRDLLRHGGGIGAAVDGSETGDDMVGPSGAGLVHGVRVDRVDRVHQSIGDVGEHDLVSPWRSSSPTKPRPMLPAPKWTAFIPRSPPKRRAESSSGVCAAESRATSSSLGEQDRDPGEDLQVLVTDHRRCRSRRSRNRLPSPHRRRSGRPTGPRRGWRPSRRWCRAGSRDRCP